LESELFGHEKGAFTGAVTRKIGRFELAHEGTLFLDEVGDIPLELQPKLLRVLQEQEFERLGNTRTTRVNVRIVAATNRDLAQMIRAKQFREDLYFRLSVFPIWIPSLRERSGDIPLLVRHYVDKYSQRMNKRVETIPPEAMAALCSYSWPGNIRELQNFIERSVILTPGSVLRVQIKELQLASPVVAATGGTLEDVEREHILQVLRETGGVVGGRHGAASRLGLKRTTLVAKMERIGISQGRKYIAVAPDDIRKNAPPVKT
jgi:formate hydrogenlyase transcriptional activator